MCVFVCRHLIAFEYDASLIYHNAATYNGIVTNTHVHTHTSHADTQIYAHTYTQTHPTQINTSPKQVMTAKLPMLHSNYYVCSQFRYAMSQPALSTSLAYKTHSSVCSVNIQLSQSFLHSHSHSHSPHFCITPQVLPQLREGREAPLLVFEVKL